MRLHKITWILWVFQVCGQHTCIHSMIQLAVKINITRVSGDSATETSFRAMTRSSQTVYNWMLRRWATQTCISPNSLPTLRQSPGQFRDKVADTNHESPWHKSRRRLSWLVSVTSPRLCRKLVPDFVVDFLCIVTDQIPLKRHKRVCRGLLTNFVANILTCRDSLCPRLSWFVSMTFLTGKFRWKSA